MDGSVVATLAGMGLGLVFCTATCIICRIWRRNRYYKKVQHSLDEEERAFQECVSSLDGTRMQPTTGEREREKESGPCRRARCRRRSPD